MLLCQTRLAAFSRARITPVADLARFQEVSVTTTTLPSLPRGTEAWHTCFSATRFPASLPSLPSLPRVPPRARERASGGLARPRTRKIFRRFSWRGGGQAGALAGVDGARGARNRLRRRPRIWRQRERPARSRRRTAADGRPERPRARGTVGGTARATARIARRSRGPLDRCTIGPGCQGGAPPACGQRQLATESEILSGRTDRERAPTGPLPSQACSLSASPRISGTWGSGASTSQRGRQPRLPGNR